MTKCKNDQGGLPESGPECEMTRCTGAACEAGQRVGKVITRLPDGTTQKEGFSLSKYVRMRSHPVRNFEDMVAFAEKVSSSPALCMIRATAIRETDEAQRRLSKPRADVPATLEDRPSCVFPVDLDGISCAVDPSENPEGAVDAIVETLPRPLTSASYWWEFSASAGLTAGKVSLRLLYWLDVPLSNKDLKSLVNGLDFGADPSIYSGAQPIYLGAPEFRNMEDPLPLRRGVRRKETSAVIVANLQRLIPSGASSRTAKRRTPNRNLRRSPSSILESLCEEVSSTPEGAPRHEILNRCGFRAGREVVGALPRGEVIQALQGASMAMAKPKDPELSLDEITRAVDDGCRVRETRGRERLFGRVEARTRDRDCADTELADWASGVDVDGVDPESRVAIHVGPDEARVTDEVFAQLHRVPNLYWSQAGYVEVRLMLDGTTLTRNVSAARLRDMLSAHFEFVKEDSEANLKETAPPTHLAPTLLERDRPPGQPCLHGIAPHPVVGRDGEVVSAAGYDPSTELFFRDDSIALNIGSVGREDAERAALDTLEVVSDFPFKCESSLCAWLAALCTHLIKPTFRCNIPMFLLSANRPGTGKTLLVQLIALILTGRSFPLSPWSRQEEEQRKALFAMLLDGRIAVVFDNVLSEIGGSTLDAVLTAGTFSDRVLGSSSIVHMPVNSVFYATGNNMGIEGDLYRRCVLIRLESDIEHPEEREDFRIADIEAHVLEQRERILTNLFTILRAYVLAGRPKQDLPPMGSFGEWSDIVRGALYWALGVDPLEATLKMKRARFGSVFEDVGLLLTALHKEFKEEPFASADVLARVRELHADELRLALDSSFRRKPQASDLGRFLSRNTGTFIQGFQLIQMPRSARGNLYQVVSTTKGGTEV